MSTEHSQPTNGESKKDSTKDNQNEVDVSDNSEQQQQSSETTDSHDSSSSVTTSSNQQDSSEVSDQKSKQVIRHYSAFVLLQLEAQENGYRFGTPYATALREIQGGQKKSHWIWYVWPSHYRVRTTQYPNLMFSSLKEILQYSSHPILLSRLCKITKIATEQMEKKKISLNTLMGTMAHVDSEKFWECISMFTIVSLVQNKTEMFEIMIRALKIIQKPLHKLVLKVMLEEEQKEKEEKEKKRKDF